MKKFWQWSKFHWQLIVVTLFGAFLRFYRLRDLTTFGGDQGIDYQFVAQMIMSGQPRLLGPITHVGVFLGPLYYYLLIPFFILFNFDPIAAPFFFAFVGSLTVGLVYVLAKKFLPSNYSFLTALLYASSPIIIESSRNPSQPNLLPFLAVLFLISIIRIIEKKAMRMDGIILGFVLGSAIQFHYLTFSIYIFFAILIGYFLIKRNQDRKNLFSLIVYCLLFIVLFLSPWFLFEIRNNFFISKQIIKYLLAGDIAVQPISLLTRFLDLSWFSVSRLVGVESQFLTLGILIFIVVGIVSRWKSLEFRLVSLYTVMNLLGIASYKDPFSDHYIADIYPSILVLAGVGIFVIFSKRVVVVILIALILFNLKQYDPFRDHGYTMPNGVTTRTIQDASRMIARDWRDQKKGMFNVANTLDGDTRGQPYRYVLFAVEKTVPAGVEHYPDSDMIYVVTNLSKKELLKDSRWELASFPVAEIRNIGRVRDNIFIYRMTAGRIDRSEVQ